MKTISAFILAATLSVPFAVAAQAQNAPHRAAPMRHHRITLMDFSAVAPQSSVPANADHVAGSSGSWHTSPGN